MQQQSALSQLLALDQLGILTQVKAPPGLAWLSDVEKGVLLELLQAGDSGLSKAYVHRLEKKLAKTEPDAVLRLTANSLAEWGTDKRGQPAYLALTWQGLDAAKVLLKVAQAESQGVAGTAVNPIRPH